MQAERVALLFDVFMASHVTTLVNAALLPIALWKPHTTRLLIGWLASVLTVTMGRVALQRCYARKRETRGSALRREISFALGALACALQLMLQPGRECLLFYAC